jgi:tetratricopeptide (TPR) repeat protein
VTPEGNEMALQLARQAMSLDPKFAPVYGVALACYGQRFDQGLDFDDVQIAEGKRYALRAIEYGADDAFSLSRAALFFGLLVKDAKTADAIVDRAIAVNPNLAEAWRVRGWISAWLGQHEAAALQFQHAMRLNPLDPEINKAEHGVAFANFFQRRFEIALSWSTKSLARQKSYAVVELYAMASLAMLGRVADAQARLRASGITLTISRLRKRTPLQRQQDVDLVIEAYRLAGMPE